MTFNSEVHHRRSIRVPGYDYTHAGIYFVTICAYQRAHLFGEVLNETVRLSSAGQIVDEEWRRSALLRPELTLDAYVIMPNHLHGIIVINRSDEALAKPVSVASVRPLRRAPKSLGSIMSGFKAAVSRRLARTADITNGPVWQRGYYEHIVRDEKALERIRQYIAANPARWLHDPENQASSDRMMGAPRTLIDMTSR